MKHSNRLVVSLCLLGFSVIAYFVTLDASLAFDAFFQKAIFSMRNETLTVFFSALTHTGDWQAVLTICIVLLALPKTRVHFGIPLSFAAGTSLIFYSIIKYIFQRPRPNIALHLIEQGGFSFPSGHTMTSLIFYGTLILLLSQYYGFKNMAVRLTHAICAAYIFLIGISRIYLGVHYPTDVLASWLLGILILTFFHTHFISHFSLPNEKVDEQLF
ncbi:MAG: phosphatase PAP2 family protein [Anaerovorax sp.]|nr:phosphatase PAP2 family protein [Anaerovorax sp.]